MHPARTHRMLAGRLVLAGLLSWLLGACQTLPAGNAQTTVQGSITDRYTGQVVAAVPVTIGRRASGFGYRHYDSLATVLSDASGQYAVAFKPLAKTGGLVSEEYVVHVLYSRDYYDLTNQPTTYPWSGTPVTLGQANQVSLEVTPYKQVTIRMPNGKAGRFRADLDFNSTDQQNWFGNIVLTDTSRTNQLLSYRTSIRVLPNRDYVFYRRLSGNGPAVSDKRLRRVLYTDTTTIVFP